MADIKEGCVFIVYNHKFGKEMKIEKLREVYTLVDLDTGVHYETT